MAINTDFSVASSGNIRHESGTLTYTVNDLHAWLQDLADDAVGAGDDQLSILDSNPSQLDGKRATDKPRALNLLGDFNIDDEAAQFFYYGSISQASGATLYTGLRTLGTPLVDESPMYVVQADTKLTKFWSDGHIQILVKAKEGTLIDDGDIRVYSRKYGQTYADFSVNLSAGGEQPAAISTQLTDWTTLSEAEALALEPYVALSIGSSYHDTGDGNGSKEYKGTITLSGTISVLDAAQYLQATCREASTSTINSVEGWQYRSLNEAYTANAAAPFGHVAGGRWFVAQGWWVADAPTADSQKYQLISHDNTTITNPVFASLAIGNLVAGARVLVGRDDGDGGFVDDEYSLDGEHGSALEYVVIKEAIKTDTPDTGYIRVGGISFEYSAWDAGTKKFTLTGALGQTFAGDTVCWVPFIDRVADAATEASDSFTFDDNFTARVKVRKGSTPDALQPFESTFAVTSAGGSANAILNADE
jgi:hypothetical protein